MAALIVVVLVSTITVVALGRGQPRFCTADGLIDPTGEHTYHRDPDRGCKWVDEDGNLKPDQ